MITRPFRWYEPLSFSIYFLGLTMLNQTMGLITPLFIQQFVGEAQQATYYGTFRLFTLMVALLAQAALGMYSDRSTSRWGRRRPYILFGTVLAVIFIILLGFTAGMAGLLGFWVLLVIGIGLYAASNIAQTAEQAVIPDLVPDEKREFFSGVKAMLEVPVASVIVAYTIGKLVSRGFIWAGLLVAAGVLIITMLISLLIPEKRLTETPAPMNWRPLLRLLAMAVLFTLIILGVGGAVKLAGGLIRSLTSPAAVFIAMSGFGLLGMLLAIALGVWLSVRISLGASARENPSFTWWVINRLAFLVGAFNLSTFALYYLQARLGYVKEAAAAPAAQLLAVVGASILPSTLAAGWLSARIGEKRTLALAGLFAALGTLIVLSAPSLLFIFLGGSIIGLGAGLFYTTNWALGTLLVPKGMAGRYLGISNLAGAGAGAVGAFIGGPIADFATNQVPQVPGFGYILIFSLYGLLFLFSVAALTQVKRPGV